MGNGLSVKVRGDTLNNGDLKNSGHHQRVRNGVAKNAYTSEQILEARVYVKTLSRQKH